MIYLIYLCKIRENHEDDARHPLRTQSLPVNAVRWSLEGPVAITRSDTSYSFTTGSTPYRINPVDHEHTRTHARTHSRDKKKRETDAYRTVKSSALLQLVAESPERARKPRHLFKSLVISTSRSPRRFRASVLFTLNERTSRRRWRWRWRQTLHEPRENPPDPGTRKVTFSIYLDSPM